MSQSITAEKAIDGESSRPYMLPRELGTGVFNPETHGVTERSSLRTVLPPEKPIVSGADSLRAVVDNVEHNIAEVRAAIEKNMTEALKLERRLEYLLKLQAISEDYKNGK